jgi:uncharacterized protein (TIGR03435 family)
MAPQTQIMYIENESEGKHRKLLPIASVLFLVFAARTIPLMAQTALGQIPQPQPVAVPEWQTAAGGKMEFEVASVRPSEPGTPYGSTVSLTDGRDGASTGNLFRADAILMPYLTFAYKISGPVQARGIWDKLPDWAKTQFFHVEARADGTPTRDQLRLMVQSLLADRFKLAIHREMQLREGYLLVLDKPGKPGPQLVPHPTDKPCVDDPSRPPMIVPPAKGTEAPRYCGLVAWRIEGQQHLRMIDVTMAQVANYLSSASMASGTPMPHSGVEETGLAGRFDVDIQFMQEIYGPGSNPDASGSTFTEALKKQLGLKLVEQKRPMEILVIDHLEKPSPN